MHTHKRCIRECVAVLALAAIASLPACTPRVHIGTAVHACQTCEQVRP